nr:hypothetical protein OG781_43270 [Streptomyces sp. NBC_00830]
MLGILLAALDQTIVGTGTWLNEQAGPRRRPPRRQADAGRGPEVLVPVFDRMIEEGL